MLELDEEARDKLVANERIKFTDTYANGLAVAIFAVGGFAPFISTALSDRPYFTPVLTAMAVFWIMSSVIHWVVRHALRNLRP